MALSAAERQKAYRAKRNARNVTEPVTEPVTLRNARCRMCSAKDKEIEMLRLDVERLKGELSVARLATREAGERVMTTLWTSEPTTTVGAPIPWHPVQTPGALEAAFAVATKRLKMPANATCGGPGKCGRIGCGHPGWGS